MIQITQDKDEIIFHETPYRQWVNAFIIGVLFGALFFFGALYFTGSVFFASIAGVIVFAAGALIFLSENPSITVKVNKNGKTVAVRKKSLVGYRFDVYNFEELAGLIYVEEVMTLKNVYRIVMPLKNGEPIAISSPLKKGDREYSDAANALNSYIFEPSLPLAEAQARKPEPNAN